MFLKIISTDYIIFNTSNVIVVSRKATRYKMIKMFVEKMRAGKAPRCSIHETQRDLLQLCYSQKERTWIKSCSVWVDGWVKNLCLKSDSKGIIASLENWCLWILIWLKTLAQCMCGTHWLKIPRFDSLAQISSPTTQSRCTIGRLDGKFDCKKPMEQSTDIEII